MTTVRAAGLYALCLTVVLPTLVSAALFPAKSPVVQLGQSSFKKEVLDIEKPTLVAFTAPWCGHCKSLAPEFHRAAVNLDGIVKFANIDCDQDTNKGICAQYQVQGFPTIKLFPATKKRLPRDYRGERSAKALVEYAKDTLPMGARKLVGTELEGWLNEAPGRPKVILFSTKPKSSPLYRSLALDYRKSVDFAFMRGDEPIVRSQGRLVLGLDIPTAETLPVLAIVPARKESGSDAYVELEKGSFETYVGALKYHKIKTWLDEVVPRMSVQGGKSKPKAKKTAAERAKEESKKVKAKYEQAAKKAEEVLPEGAFVEWKAQNPSPKQKPFQHEERDEDGSAASNTSSEDEPIMDESAPGKETWRGKMLDIERAGELADEMREKAAEVGRRTRKFAGLFNPSVMDDGEEDAPYDVSEGGGGIVVDTVKAAADSVLDGAAKVLSDAKEAVVSAGDKAVGRKGKPFERKSDALMKQFQKWMAGEAPQDWEEHLGDQFARAQADAEELLRKDPDEAQRQAWESEEWLLKQMRGDQDRMESVMTVEQRAQVDNMIELIEGRLSKKQFMDPFRRDADTQFPFAQEQVPNEKPQEQQHIPPPPPVVHHDATDNKPHDEL